MGIKVIAFDADDTLWENEHYFKRVEDSFCELLSEYLPATQVQQELNKAALANISLYGFGIKSFMLTMIEAGLSVAEGSGGQQLVREIIALGKQMLNEPVEVMPGVEAVLRHLQRDYKLIVATKGDLLDQERKLQKSGLLPYFHHVEIMSDKDEHNYRKLVKHLDVAPEEFLMIGNSLKSDILPVLKIGGNGIHIPYHITNIHEQVTASIDNDRFRSFVSIEAVLTVL